MGQRGVLSVKRGPIGASKITVPVLGGNRARDHLGLIDRILKRNMVAKHLATQFPNDGSPVRQHPEVRNLREL